MELAHDKVPHRPTYNSNSVLLVPFLAKPGLSPLALGESGVFPFCNQREALPGECPIASLKKLAYISAMTSYLRGLVVSVPSVPTS